MPIVLRSPFNGQNWTVPEDMSSALVDELLKRGFERVTDAPSTDKEKSHGASQSARRARTRPTTGADARSYATAFDAESGTQSDAAPAVED